MHGFIILMFIFGGAVFLFGFYLYRGHDARAILWRAPFINATDEDFINIGKATMITSLSPILTGVIALLVEEDSWIPIAFLCISLLGFPFIGAKWIKHQENKK